ncbi:imm11 family protein (plasmid) [Microbulbifer sp. SSSA002]|uniref:imm11 family protein n=1 Tax=Microbulbifer sp. SSSA002 TaxID=3243376 RepID=UPI004039A9D0
MAYLIKLDYNSREPQFEFLDEPQEMAIFGLSTGVHIDPSRFPTKAKEETKKKVIPDIFSMPGLNAVSQRFKDLVEEFEPGIHQFLPLDLFKKTGDPIDGNFYTFNCGKRLDAVLNKHSNVEWMASNEVTGEPELDIDVRYTNYLSAPRIKGHHFWSSDYQRVIGVYVSEEVFKRLKTEKFKYFKFQHWPELDELWFPEENIGPFLEWEAAQQH